MHLGLAREGLPEGGIGICGHPATWRCLTCHGTPALCAACCRNRHVDHPLHRVEHWTGSYYHPGWLRELGVQIHAGHDGRPCPVLGTYSGPFTDDPERTATEDDDGPHLSHPDDDFLEVEDEDADLVIHAEDETLLMSPDDLPRFGDPLSPPGSLFSAAMYAGDRMMVVVDVDGIHELSVTFCGCENAPREDLQILALGYYPATTQRPRTMFTQRVLDDFLLSNKECKTAARNYYNKLRRTTNDAFPHMVPVRTHLQLLSSQLTLRT